MTGSVAWILVVGACLAGIVAINVAVLRLNVELDRLSSVRADLRADIATGKAQLSSASSHTRIETEAATRLGLVQADPTTTEYIRVQPRR